MIPKFFLKGNNTVKYYPLFGNSRTIDLLLQTLILVDTDKLARCCIKALYLQNKQRRGQSLMSYYSNYSPPFNSFNHFKFF